MTIRKSLIYVSVVAVLVIAGLVLLNRPSSTPRRPKLVDSASLGPDFSAGKSGKATPTPTPTPAPPAMNSPGVSTPTLSVRTENPELDPVPPGGRAMGGDGEDIRNSPEKLAMIDKVQTYADDIFSKPGEEEGWTVNQQDMDQQDYAIQDGTEVTKWYTGDGSQSASVQAEEAQLPNGEVVDRWYGDNGKVNQVMHQFDDRNSFSVYYYDNGQPEATRVIKDGNEIFTKFDRNGRQIEKTYTPQVRE